MAQMTTSRGRRQSGVIGATIVLVVAVLVVSFQPTVSGAPPDTAPAGPKFAADPAGHPSLVEPSLVREFATPTHVGGTVAIGVIDERGAAVPGAMVLGTAGSNPAERLADTGDDGWAMVTESALTEMDWLVATAEGFAPGRVRADGVRRTIVVAKGQELVVTVHDRNGSPIQGATVRLCASAMPAAPAYETVSRNSSTAHYASQSVFSLSTDGQGVARFSSLARGSAYIVVEKAGYAQVAANPRGPIYIGQTPSVAVKMAGVWAAALMFEGDTLLASTYDPVSTSSSNEAPLIDEALRRRFPNAWIFSCIPPKLEGGPPTVHAKFLFACAGVVQHKVTLVPFARLESPSKLEIHRPEGRSLGRPCVTLELENPGMMAQADKCRSLNLARVPETTDDPEESFCRGIKMAYGASYIQPVTIGRQLPVRPGRYRVVSTDSFLQSFVQAKEFVVSEEEDKHVTLVLSKPLDCVTVSASIDGRPVQSSYWVIGVPALGLHSEFAIIEGYRPHPMWVPRDHSVDVSVRSHGCAEWTGSIFGAGSATRGLYEAALRPTQ